MVFFMQDESHSQEPGPSISVQTAPVRYPPPQRTVQRETKETQTLVFDDKEKCRMCGEGELDKRALWVGCNPSATIGYMFVAFTARQPAKGLSPRSLGIAPSTGVVK